MDIRSEGKWCWYRSIELLLSLARLASSASGKSAAREFPLGGNLVASKHCSPRASSPRRSSEAPLPYISAVSKSVTPAARLNSMARFSSAGPPEPPYISIDEVQRPLPEGLPQVKAPRPRRGRRSSPRETVVERFIQPSSFLYIQGRER